MSKRDKLNVAVEKACHKHVNRVKESVVDFTHLYLRRNNIEVDRPSLAVILDTVVKGIESEHMNKIDTFIKELDAALAEFSVED